MDVLSSNPTPYCHISLSCITSLSLMQTIKEVNPHSRIASRFNKWSVLLLLSLLLVLLLFLFLLLCHLLNCWCTDMPHYPRRSSGRLTCEDGILFFLHKLRNSIAMVTQNTTNMGKPVQPEWKSRNNAHLQSIHSSDN